MLLGPMEALTSSFIKEVLFELCLEHGKSFSDRKEWMQIIISKDSLIKVYLPSHRSSYDGNAMPCSEKWGSVCPALESWKGPGIASTQRVWQK